MPAKQNTERSLIKMFNYLIKFPGAFLYLLFLILVLIFESLSEPQIEIVLYSSDFDQIDVFSSDDFEVATDDNNSELPLYIRKLLDIITEPLPSQ